MLHYTNGNGRILVLIDSNGRLCDQCIVGEYLFNALIHMGIPFAVHDLAGKNLSSKEALNSAALLVAQENLLSRITDKSWQAINEAVSIGVGLINFDCNLLNASSKIQRLLGIVPEKYPIYSDLFRSGKVNNYISELREPGVLVKAKKFLPVYPVRECSSKCEIILQAILGRDQLIYTRHLIPGLSLEPSHIPAILVNKAHAGKIVQYMVSPRLWLPEFFGHAAGLDDIFYRSIVFAARKPFLTKTIPTFATVRIDDCSGTHLFKYIDIFNKYGIIPSIPCFWDSMGKKEWQAMKARHKRKTAEFSTHAFSYYKLLTFNFGVGEYSEKELHKLFAKEDQVYKQHKLKRTRTFHTHWGEDGANSIPFLKKRGIRYIGSPFRLGELKCERTFLPVGPYNSPLFGYGPLEEDPSLFRIYNRFKAQEMPTLDFLEGDTITWLGQSSFNNLDKAIDNGAGQIEAGLNSYYFGELITHEQKFSVLTLKEIEQIVKGIVNKVQKLQPIFKSYDYISEYIENHSLTWLKNVEIKPDGDILSNIGGKKPSLTMYAQKHIQDNSMTLKTI